MARKTRRRRRSTPRRRNYGRRRVVSRRRRRNPLWRRRKGFGRGLGGKFSGRRSKRAKRMTRLVYGGWRNNPRKKGRRRTFKRRTYRKNPGALALRGGPIGALQSALKDAFSTDTLEQVLHVSIGFGGTVIGTKVLTDLVGVDMLKTGYGKVAATVGTSILGSVAAGMVGGRKVGARFMVGGMIAAFMRLLNEVLPEEYKGYVPTLGDDASYDFQKAIEREVLAEMGYGYAQPVGMDAYLTASEAAKASGMGAYLTASEAARASGMGAYYQPVGVASYDNEYDAV